LCVALIAHGGLRNACPDLARRLAHLHKDEVCPARKVFHQFHEAMMNEAARIDLDAALRAASRDPTLIEAAGALQQNRLAVAERLLRARLHDRPTDIAAIRMLAEVAGRLGRYADAEKLLARALELAPQFTAARANYVTVLHRQSKFTAALAEVDRLLAAEPDDAGHLALKAAVLVRTGGYDEAIAAYEKILARFPDQPRLWISYGHVLKTVGRQDESIGAYRRAIAYQDTLGDAWWSLANLKTVRFDREDMAAMRSAIERAPTASDRYHLHFALGKALEDARDHAASFSNYAEGNRLRRAELPYNAAQTSQHVARVRKLLTADALAARAGWGDPAPDPIFVVGLPRAGSTLIEQILASHSLVEGTMELADIGTITHDLSGRGVPPDEDEAVPGYLPRLLALGPEEMQALGRRYIENTRIQRKSDRPFFVDKMPNNFAHIGLIHLILPNAKIIDARRHPMANGFSAYKQHFSRGQGFTYDLDELGRYYRDYVEIMEHYGRVLPGLIHRVHYEDMVANPEAQTRALLAHCGLAFEAACLTFHETKRAVRTASSEQVRRPMTTEAVDHWHHYSPWLGPLAHALGDVVDRYPARTG